MNAGNFRSLIGTAVSGYEAIVQENASLRAEIAALKQKLATINALPVPVPSNAVEKSQATQQRRPSTPFWQTKQKVPYSWTPIPIEFSDSVTCMHVSNDDLIAFGCADSTISMFSQSSQKQAFSVQGHRGLINCIVSDTSTGLYASCSGDGCVNIWSPQMNTPFQKLGKRSSDHGIIVANTTLSHHTAPVYCATWINSDGHLVTGSQDSSICLWDVTHSADCIKHEDLKSSVLSLDSSNGIAPNIAAGLSNGDVVFFDQRAPTTQSMSCNHGKCSVIQVKYMGKDGMHLISAGSDTNLCIWDMRSPTEPIDEIDIDRTPTKFSIRDEFAVVPCELGHMRIVDLSTLAINIIESTPFSYTISCADFINSKEQTIVAASWDGTAAIGKIYKK